MYSRDADGARSTFEKALGIDSEHIGARIPLHQKRFAEAGRLAEAVIGDAPENPEASFIKGSALHASGLLAQAAEAYGRAYEIDSGNLQAVIGQAGALMDGANPASAATLLRGLRKDHPNSPTILYLPSKALSASDRTDEAKRALAEAANIVSQYSPVDVARQPNSLLVFGNIAFESGELEQAFGFLSTYVDGSGKDSRGRKTLARALIGLGRPGDALRVLVRISANQQADAETLILFGDANTQLRDYEAAQRHYRDALANYGGGPAVARRLAMAQYHSGQRAEGIATLQELVDLLPDDGRLDSSLLLGFIYLASNRFDEAEKIARSVLTIAPDDKIARNFLATMLVRQGEGEQARALYSELIADDPDFRPARFNLIGLDIAQGDYARASQELNEILALDPNDTQALLESARIALLQGDARSAVHLLEKLRSIKPDWLHTDITLASIRAWDRVNGSDGANDKDFELWTCVTAASAGGGLPGDAYSDWGSAGNGWTKAVDVNGGQDNSGGTDYDTYSTLDSQNSSLWIVLAANADGLQDAFKIKMFSAIVVCVPGSPGCPGGEVPAPATLALLAIGILASRRRMLRSAKAHG